MRASPPAQARWNAGVNHAPACLAALLCCLVGGALLADPAAAWLARGHEMVTRGGLESLPESVPSFLREGATTVSHVAVDADLARAREAPQLRAQEHPEHFFNLERLGGEPLPPDRSRFLWLVAQRRLGLWEVGALPYAVSEWAQRLMLALAEHRRWPDDPHVQAKALIYAGHLSHYTGDLCQPLHTTVHHDGRAAPPRWRSPRSGIHWLADALLEAADFDRGAALEGLSAGVLEDLFAGVVAELERSHSLVERVYALEPELPAPGSDRATSPRVAAFAAERLRSCAGFYGTLVNTAWEHSAQVELPQWLVRYREGSRRESPGAPLR
jgi:hypothetical protein